MAVIPKKYNRLLIQLTALVVLSIIIFTIAKSNNTRDMIIETTIKPNAPSKNIRLVSDLHTVSCVILPLVGEVCLKKYGEEDIVNKDILQNKHRYKNSYKKWLQFGFTKYLVMKRVNDVDDSVLEGLHKIAPKNQQYKKLTIQNETIYLTYHKNTNKEVTSNRILNVDILFGKGAMEARDNYKLLDDIVIGKPHKGVEMYLSLQTEKANIKSEDNSIVNKDAFFVDPKKMKSFKIMQIADLHYAVGTGVCRDPFPEEKYSKSCEADVITDNFITKLLKQEKPDFVVFSGDQIMGDLCTQDSETCLLKAVKPVIDKKIPYTFIWGNHDDEGSLSRLEISKFASNLPYSYYKHEELKNGASFGYGNNVIKFSTEAGELLMQLFFLDSHKYSPKPKIYPGYDWIKEEQWEYVTSLSQSSSASLNAAFYHIPLPEYRYSDIEIANGELKEGITAPKYDYEVVTNVFAANNISFGSCGHDHVNDFCGKIHGTWLCYGGASGMGGYAGYGGYERRTRFFDINLTTKQVATYKKVMDHENVKLDLFTLN